jgi:HD superfamily phosphodiesterase
MDQNGIYKKVEQHVAELYQKSHDPNLLYHNFDHTKSVVSRTKEIAGHYNLIENDMIVLFVAAWFHDTGYLFEEPSRHEQKSVELMREFVSPLLNDDDVVNSIAECIMSTRGSVEPVNLLQQILCDADTYHLGTKDFSGINKLVFEEYRLQHAGTTRTEWNEKTIAWLENHQYYTTYCKDLLNDKKRKNLKKLKKQSAEMIDAGVDKDELITGQNNFTTKGIQTMLRLTSENHMKLSDMADGKANILISVNAIIISVVLSVLFRRIQTTDAYLAIPTILFLGFAVTTIVISILATRPKVNEGTFSDQDVIDKKTNLLFFGNFYKVELPHYEQAMAKMMVDPNYLYRSLVKDIYHLGVVVARKYRLIRLAYNIFMIGIIVSVLAFGIAVFFGSSPDATISNSTGGPL